MMEYLTGLLRMLGIYDDINFKEPRLHEVRHLIVLLKRLLIMVNRP